MTGIHETHKKLMAFWGQDQVEIWTEDSGYDTTVFDMAAGIEPTLPAPRPGKWFVYALECEDDSIYVGQTENIEERWKQHASGKGAEWTKRHPPVRLVHWEEFDSLQAAVNREKELKTGFGRKWLKREYTAGRTRQAGEPASVLLKRIRAEREKALSVRATGRSPRRRRRK